MSAERSRPAGARWNGARRRGGRSAARARNRPVLERAPAEAADELTDAVEEGRSAGNHLAVVHASGGLAAISAEAGDLQEADRIAQAALQLADERSLAEHWATAMARVVHGRALEQKGKLAEANDEIERATELSQRGVAAIEIAYSLLSRAEGRSYREIQRAPPRSRPRPVRRGRRPDPGILREMLARTERQLHLASPRRAADGDVLPDESTERETPYFDSCRAALQREIASTLYAR